MKRSELKRTTPLKRTQMRRTAPSRSALGKNPLPPKAKSKPRRMGFTDEVKAEGRRRSGNLCEVRAEGCTGRATEFHHRKLRRHGDHTLANLLHACYGCHHDKIHNDVMKAYMMGWLVRSTLDPANVPVRRGDG